MVKYTRPALYITYDGLLDPLGRSQILPYIFKISLHSKPIHILSFEKFDLMFAEGKMLRKKLDKHAIKWIALSFTQRFGLLGKIWDLFRMHYWALRLALVFRFSIIHARGHLAAQSGSFIKRFLKLKLIFDFRGLWVDERVDKGSWDLSKFSHRIQFRYYKRIERILLNKADHIVVLTKAVIEEVIRLGAGNAKKITVIPCCADFSHFKIVDSISRSSARKFFSISDEAFVLGYSGSVGAMYMLDRFFRLVDFAAKKNNNIQVLALTRDIHQFKKEMLNRLPESLHKYVHIYSANRQEIPDLLPAMDVLVSFIRPSYARIGASPTKLAESFALGIPVICNHGVGDVAKLVSSLDAGVVLNVDSDEILNTMAEKIHLLKLKGGHRLRNEAKTQLSLEIAAEKYKKIYSKMYYSKN